MAPANLEHVDLNGWLLTLLRLFVEQRDAGAVLGPELLVRLTASRRVPDLFFLKKENLHRLRPTCLDGAPDLAVELISPDSAARDWREKYLEYESIGVGEYWVIDPLGDDRRFHLNPAKDDKIASGVLPGFYLRPSWLWQKPLPRVAGVLREMGVAL
jgi:Uma2 family endonuclease